MIVETIEHTTISGASDIRAKRSIDIPTVMQFDTLPLVVREGKSYAFSVKADSGLTAYFNALYQDGCFITDMDSIRQCQPK